jgi:hypothetical protein
MDEIKKIYDEHLRTSFPDLRGEEIHGIDLVLIDSDTAGLISKYLSHRGQLTEDDFRIINYCYSELKLVVKELDGINRQYFARLQNIAGLIIDDIKKNKKEKIKDYKSGYKPDWEPLFLKFRDILNEWDPLGVADSVIDEYDSINFRILSAMFHGTNKEEIINDIDKYILDTMQIKVDIEILESIIDKIYNIFKDINNALQQRL